MKLFHYIFGFMTALFIFSILFNLHCEEFIDDYWLNILHTYYAQEWYYTCLTIGALEIICTTIWIYNLGKGANELSREPLIKKEEDNE